MLSTLLLLLADGDAPKAPPGPENLLSSPLVPLMGMFFLVYLFFLRPASQRREQERLALLNNMKKNDKVITHAGIYGTIVSVAEKEDEIVVRVDDNVRLKMVKASIMRNLTNEEAAKEAKEKGKKTPDKAPDDKTASSAPAAKA
jgi:preprotein translocase subunit YajC